MDYSKMTTAQMQAAANVLMQIDETVICNLPPNFSELLAEYMAMDEADRMQLQSEMSAKANFKAYAQALGNADMAEALQKVAEDMAKMDAKALRGIADGGLSKATK